MPRFGFQEAIEKLSVSSRKSIRGFTTVETVEVNHDSGLVFPGVCQSRKAQNVESTVYEQVARNHRVKFSEFRFSFAEAMDSYGFHNVELHGLLPECAPWHVQAARHLQRVENSGLVFRNHAAASAKRRAFSAGFPQCD
jgi:hypothetical protein